jgi:3',5'-cyclic AMP phosphodiesterase CpdA
MNEIIMIRIIRKLAVVLLLLSTITIIGNSQNRNSSAPFFIIQITDPQFGMYESDKGFNKETELYEKAIEAINKLNPDFVVITGDLVNKKEDRTQVAEFKRITAKIKPGIPVYYSPGNHDIGQPPSQEDIDIFIKDYGHDKFSFSHKKSLFIGLNSCVIKSNDPVFEKQQFDWLKKELSKSKRAKQTLIFTHYPFFINAFDEPETYSNIAIETRKRYLTIFKEFGVDAVFAGHLHNNGSAGYGDMQMITTSAVGKPLGKVPSGLRIIKVYHDHVESVYYTLNEIPVSVGF